MSNISRIAAGGKLREKCRDKHVLVFN